MIKMCACDEPKFCAFSVSYFSSRSSLCVHVSFVRVLCLGGHIVEAGHNEAETRHNEVEVRNGEAEYIKEKDLRYDCTQRSTRVIARSLGTMTTPRERCSII